MNLNRLFVVFCCFFRGEAGGEGGRRETIQGAWGMFYRNPDL